MVHDQSNHGPSRRKFVKKAAYVVPAVLSLAVAPAYVKAGSNERAPGEAREADPTHHADPTRPADPTDQSELASRRIRIGGPHGSRTLLDSFGLADLRLASCCAADRTS